MSFRLFLLCGLALTQLTRLGVAHGASPIVDSGAWVRSGGNRVIYWMDDRQLIFIGRDLNKPATHPNSLPALMQWEIGKPAVVLRHNVEGLCYRPGQIRYTVIDPQVKTRTFYRGELGREIPGKPSSGDALGCGLVREPLWGLENRAVRRLLPGHGYLDLGAARGEESMKDTPVVHVGNDSKKTELPFRRRQALIIEYYDFKSAYFIRGGSPPPNTLGQAYWLWPDGRSERVEFPGDISPHPTRVGLAYRITGLKESDNGLYLLTMKGERVRIAAGHVLEIATSPDGCKVAFSHARDAQSDRGQPKPPKARTLKIADICLGRLR